MASPVESVLECGGVKTLVMGIVNVTPDSLFDGGRFPNSAAAVAHAEQLLLDGADVLDIGGESSRPGARAIGLDEELERVLPVLEGLAHVDAPISVDTYRAETARRAMALGATMINDITALRGDSAMAAVVAEARCPCVLMHMRGTPLTMQDAPVYDDVIDDICAFFEERIGFAVEHGIAEDALWLDPGFGFGKTVSHNLLILRRLNEFKRFGRPVLVGTSNKSTIGKVLDAEADDRTDGTAATVAVAIQNGADAVRVHDVRTMVRVAKMTDAILGRGCYD